MSPPGWATCAFAISSAMLAHMSRLQRRCWVRDTTAKTHWLPKRVISRLCTDWTLSVPTRKWAKEVKMGTRLKVSTGYDHALWKITSVKQWFILLIWLYKYFKRSIAKTGRELSQISSVTINIQVTAIKVQMLLRDGCLCDCRSSTRLKRCTEQGQLCSKTMPEPCQVSHGVCRSLVKWMMFTNPLQTEDVTSRLIRPPKLQE